MGTDERQLVRIGLRDEEGLLQNKYIPFHTTAQKQNESCYGLTLIIKLMNL